MCIINECHNKDKYGEYCTKHKRIYLVSNGIILYERFTDKQSDYLKNDIIKSIKHIDKNYKLDKSKKKDILFQELQKYYHDFKKYDINKIIKIQRFYKDYQSNKLVKLRGEGFLNKKSANNDTDFFTYETYDEINDKYYFSYKDDKKFIWFFDIRSFNKLVELNQPNPYTMNIIPKDIIEKSKKLTKILNLGNKDEVVDKQLIQVSRKQLIKQKCIDLCCDIETSTMYCHPEWFLLLNIPYLKKLYRNLEDLWNYRLQLTNDVKSRICPPNGLAFTTRVSDVNRITDGWELRNLILNEILKFQNAQSIEDKKMGYTYFIIGLGSVSRSCYECHTWLMNI
tara:strand:+ start:127 stop:1143 length:1017 start_codon:yes stop_codon:yes gene_type:complete